MNKYENKQCPENKRNNTPENKKNPSPENRKNNGPENKNPTQSLGTFPWVLNSERLQLDSGEEAGLRAGLFFYLRGERHGSKKMEKDKKKGIQRPGLPPASI